MIQRKRILQQSGIFLKQNPGEAHLTIDELREIGLCQLTQTALKGFLARKFKHDNDCSDGTELDQDIEAGQKAADTVCQYVDWLLSTINPNPPDEDVWIRPEVHPCQRNHHDIHENDKQSDYVDLLNMFQRHTHCSTSYCLRKKSNETELKCRFHFPFELYPKTRLEFEKNHSSGHNENYRAKIVTKRNDSRFHNRQKLQLQGWREPTVIFKLLLITMLVLNISQNMQRKVNQAHLY